MESLEEKLLHPIRSFGKGSRLLMVLLLSVIGLGVFAWINQLIFGLSVTGMNKPVFWGIYITNFVFFIGISHAGTLISAILRLCHAEWRRPITRAAEAITVFALLIAAPQIILDIGRPERILNVFRYGRFQSPILWDVTCILAYLTCSIIYLYLPLIPDLALLRDKLSGISRWRTKLYKVLSLGWKGTPQEFAKLNRRVAIMAIIVIPLAVSVHTVVSWIFGMTLQPMWHTTILGPYFVTGAIYTGIASLLIALAILRRVFHLENFIKPLHFNNLGKLLLVMNLLWFYFTFAEYVTTFYGGQAGEMAVFISKFQGEFASLFWGMVILMTISFIILAFRKLRTVKGIVLAAILINIAMWIERFTIVVPSLTRPRLPYSMGIYKPTWIEWSLTFASFAAFILFYVLFSKLFPIISLWEVREGKEKAIGEITERYKSYQPADAEEE